ncbi:hypothetical protein VNO78_33197 [Psophocarpus tetragonolobus]|uniref:Uncharacterized protein n=1 Tax=Psophocarpus tetragonolobus TaxID=3891 RepID=A0AAN9NXJ2_PSOTE
MDSGLYIWQVTSYGRGLFCCSDFVEVFGPSGKVNIYVRSTHMGGKSHRLLWLASVSIEKVTVMWGSPVLLLISTTLFTGLKFFLTDLSSVEISTVLIIGSVLLCYLV